MSNHHVEMEYASDRKASPHRIDISGQKFGRLTVIAPAECTNSKIFWLCHCDCGNYVNVKSRSLRKGLTSSCGCINRQRFRQHGYARTRIHNIWKAMRKRCRDPESYVGKRNIKVCERWESFENFYADMGEPPTRSHSIDRINNDGDYTPENCHWATPLEQSNNQCKNRVYTVDGATHTMSEWSRIAGIPYYTLRSRLDRGMSIKIALTRPVKE